MPIQPPDCRGGGGGIAISGVDAASGSGAGVGVATLTNWWIQAGLREAAKRKRCGLDI